MFPYNIPLRGIQVQEDCKVYQVRQDRQERKEGSGESSCFSTSFLGDLGVLGGFS